MAGETKFTAGPWRVDPSWPADIQSGDGRLEIASTAEKVLTGGEKPNRATQIANAALIAAAPELYEALTDLRATLAEMDAELHAQNIAVIDLVLAKIGGAS